MSDDSMDSNAGSNSTPTSSPEKRRSTVPDILPHQSSFEKRYSHMIHKQILETGVNKEALQRQINAYFSCGGAASSTKGAQEGAHEDVNENAATGAEQQGQEGRKSLDKAETVDIAELQDAKASAGEL
ncbi:unnamed protein product [Ceratitis capitata]|uniref:(Mediterranean fruit fly) hypothetical protein n=1 Tax=Ceratitis capitata TaxID=7213 RepID=A0A811V9D2_CERCA|nr:unnamed protein product [Ceratitis capitata]CAD7012489.1 unnamed protein product [Ceratitis capitata]